MPAIGLRKRRAALGIEQIQADQIIQDQSLASSNVVSLEFTEGGKFAEIRRGDGSLLRQPTGIREAGNVFLFKRDTTDTGAPTAAEAGGSVTGDTAMIRTSDGAIAAFQKFDYGWETKFVDPAMDDQPWIDSVASTQVLKNQKIRVAPNHELDVPLFNDGEEFEMGPLGGDWSPVWAGTGGINTPDGWTFGAGQIVPAGSAVIRCVARAATSNFELFFGGNESAAAASSASYLCQIPNGTVRVSGQIMVAVPQIPKNFGNGITDNGDLTFTLDDNTYDVEVMQESSAGGSVQWYIAPTSNPAVNLGLNGTTDGGGYAVGPAVAQVTGPATIGTVPVTSTALGNSNSYFKIKKA